MGHCSKGKRTNFELPPVIREEMKWVIVEDTSDTTFLLPPFIPSHACDGFCDGLSVLLVSNSIKRYHDLDFAWS